jgi:DNA-binding CsgD family transcriptional regulator
MDGRRYGNEDAQEIGADPTTLTPREREVAELLSAGASYAQVALELSISQATVATHCKHIYRKLGVKGRYALRALRTPRAPEPWGRHPGPSRSLANARRVTVRGLGQLNDRQSNHTAHAGSGIYR